VRAESLTSRFIWRQLYVPKAWEERVRRAVKDYQELQTLVEELSELEWRRLTRKEEEARS
jgi:hypothetical protein